MERSHTVLGSAFDQLVSLLDVARADDDPPASIGVSCGHALIEVSCIDGVVRAIAGRDPSRPTQDTLRFDDEIVLEILGWRIRDEDHIFTRDWCPATPSSVIAEDILRCADNAFECGEVALHLLLPSSAPVALTS